MSLVTVASSRPPRCAAASCGMPSSPSCTSHTVATGIARSAARTVARMTTPDDGYFAPGGPARTISRELALMLGGGRALLLQVAHPLVAAGVAAHSGYRENPWKRLEGTMNAVWAIVFGTRAQADRAARRVRAMHGRVHGRTAEPMGPYPAGTPYSAMDPELLLWVHATLVDTALLVHAQWVRPLSEAEQAAYYEEMKVCARLFGTPDDVLPDSFPDFR